MRPDTDQKDQEAQEARETQEAPAVDRDAPPEEPPEQEAHPAAEQELPPGSEWQDRPAEPTEYASAQALADAPEERVAPGAEEPEVPVEAAQAPYAPPADEAAPSAPPADEAAPSADAPTAVGVAPVEGGARWPQETMPELERRWQEVLVQFVDNPPAATQAARLLVTEVVDQFTATLTVHKRELDGWGESAGEEDTERLRTAVRGYGALLDRLLRT